MNTLTPTTIGTNNTVLGALYQLGNDLNRQRPFLPGVWFVRGENRFVSIENKSSEEKEICNGFAN